MTEPLPEGYTYHCTEDPAGPDRCPNPAVSDGPMACATHLPAALGITYRQLDMWARNGYLHPQVYGGSGTARGWPAAEAEIARRMGRLTAAGLTVERAAAFAREDWPRSEIAPGITLEVTS
jgi:hypothetical protein